MTVKKTGPCFLSPLLPPAAAAQTTRSPPFMKQKVQDPVNNVPRPSSYKLCMGVALIISSLTLAARTLRSNPKALHEQLVTVLLLQPCMDSGCNHR